MTRLGSIPGATLLKKTRTWKRIRHRMSLLTDERTNSHFTGFLRLPTQFQALVGPVMTLLRAHVAQRTVLNIGALGCSNGAEAYSVSSVLRRYHPAVDFRVLGYDIDPVMVEKARSARYAHDEIFNNNVITTEFVESTFVRDGGSYVIRPDIAERVEFDVGDVLGHDLTSRVGPCHIIFAQNFIFHLERNVARQALENIFRLVQRSTVLFMDGIDLDLRHGFVRRKGLIPLDYQIEQIHNDACRARHVGWPYHYWGLEPFMTTRADRNTHYATIFQAP